MVKQYPAERVTLTTSIIINKYRHKVALCKCPKARLGYQSFPVTPSVQFSRYKKLPHIPLYHPWKNVRHDKPIKSSSNVITVQENNHPIPGLPYWKMRFPHLVCPSVHADCVTTVKGNFCSKTFVT